MVISFIYVVTLFLKKLYILFLYFCFLFQKRSAYVAAPYDPSFFVLISRQLWPWLPFRPYRTFLSSSILSHSQMH